MGSYLRKKIWTKLHDENLYSGMEQDGDSGQDDTSLVKTMTSLVKLMVMVNGVAKDLKLPQIVSSKHDRTTATIILGVAGSVDETPARSSSNRGTTQDYYCRVELTVLIYKGFQRHSINKTITKSHLFDSDVFWVKHLRRKDLQHYHGDRAKLSTRLLHVKQVGVTINGQTLLKVHDIRKDNLELFTAKL
jgi:hypothetical protein